MKDSWTYAGLAGLAAVVLFLIPSAPAETAVTPVNPTTPVTPVNPVQPGGATGFDYGTIPAPTYPLTTTPARPFTATPPRSSAMVIDSDDDVYKSTATAFPDIPPAPAAEEPEVKKPVAAAPPKAAVPAPTAEPPTAFPEVKKEPIPSGPVSNAAPGYGANWTANVYPISANGGNVGCAVAISADTLLTVYHVAKFGNVNVGINGAWVPAQVLYVNAADDGLRDGALLKIPNGQLPTLPVRAPKYYEPVTIYGLRTKTQQRGFVSTARTVSLLPDNTGVASGDSGGAVVADDGHLIGIVTGNEAASQAISTPANPRVVYMSRADMYMPLLPRSAPRSGMPPSNEMPPLPAGPRAATPNNMQPAWNQPSIFDQNPQVQQPYYNYNGAPNCGNGNGFVYEKRRVYYRIK